MRALALMAATILLALGIGAYFFVLAPGQSFTNYPPRQGPIVAFGDSLVYGTGATEGNDFVSRLSARLRTPIQNRGVPGDTAADGLARIDEVLAVKPSIVLVLLGGNDYLRRVPPAETFEHLSRIIDRLQDNGALVVLLGVRGGLLQDNFRESFESLARQKNAVYVPDVLDGLIGNTNLMADQVHPNDAGHERIAEKVAATLEPLLR